MMANSHGPDTYQLRRLLEDTETKDLDLSGLNITSIPFFPDHITSLTLENPNLKSLPPFPNCLKLFWCSKTPITTLPDFPDGFEGFYYEGEHLLALPTLPSSLNAIICWGAPFTTLPDLPDGLYLLSCTRSSLTVLPELPATLRYLDCTGSPLLLEQQADETIQDYSLRWSNWREEQSSKKRCQERCGLVKEDLIAEAMHPRRIQRWLDTYGFDVLECI